MTAEAASLHRVLQSVTYLLRLPVPWTSVTFGARLIQKCCKPCFLLFVAGDAMLVAALKKVWRPWCVYKCIGLLNLSSHFSDCKKIAAFFIVKHTRRVRSCSVMPNGAFECSLEYRCVPAGERSAELLEDSSAGGSRMTRKRLTLPELEGKK